MAWARGRRDKGPWRERGRRQEALAATAAALLRRLAPVELVRAELGQPESGFRDRRELLRQDPAALWRRAEAER